MMRELKVIKVICIPSVVSRVSSSFPFFLGTTVGKGRLAKGDPVVGEQQGRRTCQQHANLPVINAPTHGPPSSVPRESAKNHCHATHLTRSAAPDPGPRIVRRGTHKLNFTLYR